VFREYNFPGQAIDGGDAQDVASFWRVSRGRGRLSTWLRLVPE